MKKVAMILFAIVLIITLSTIFVLRQDKFGKLPSGERLAKIEASPNYRNGSFQNLSHTPELTEGYSMWDVIKRSLFTRYENKKPKQIVPSKKIDLHGLNADENTLVWFGHSSYFLQVDGKKILIDPVLSGHASPFSFSIKAFEGTDVYEYDDIPEIDYLFITHDHWDHLDYKTIKALKPKFKKIVCGLGVGSHLEHWGIAKDIIIETDWNDNVMLDKGFTSNTTSARHFSGRGFKRNKTLWVSFVLQTPNTKLFLGGDSGYDSHFAEIGEKYGPFDLVLLENGQYDDAWKYIHMHPDEVLKAATDLKAGSLLPGHSGKFDLANHAWNTPLKTISDLYNNESFSLITPIIGEKVSIGNQQQNYIKWWTESNMGKIVVR